MKHTKRLGDGPIEPELVKGMHAVAMTIDEFFNEDARETGFVLLVFRFGDTGRCSYISNADRRDVVRLLHEQLKRFETQPTKKGAARGDKPHGNN